MATAIMLTSIPSNLNLAPLVGSQSFSALVSPSVSMSLSMSFSLSTGSLSKLNLAGIPGALSKPVNLSGEGCGARMVEKGVSHSMVEVNADTNVPWSDSTLSRIEASVTMKDVDVDVRRAEPGEHKYVQPLKP